MNRERVGIADERAVAGLSRRQLLGAMTAAGAAGGFVGVSTGASLFDRERFDAGLTTGVVDLVVGSSIDDGTERIVDGSQVTLDLGQLSPGDSGHADLRLLLPETGSAAAPNNPAYPWFRPSCIEASGGLADALRVQLSYDCENGNTDIIFPWGSLREFVEAFRDGSHLDGEGRPSETDPVGTPGEQACLDDERCLRLDYALRGSYEGRGSVQVDIDFVAVQCRNHTGTENPFVGRPGRRCDAPDVHGISYIEVWADIGGTCTTLGKLELDDDYTSNCGATLDVAGDGDTEPIGENYIVEGVYDLPVDDDCADSGYDLEVTETVTKTEGGATEVVGIAFALLNGDGSAGPDLCKVVVKGGAVGQGGAAGSDAGTVTYDDPSDFDGNATNGLLYAQEESR